MIKLKSKISTFKELEEIDHSAYIMYNYLVSSRDIEILNKNSIYYGFGLLVTNRGLYVLVAEEHDDYVTLKPLCLFDIINYEIPKYWKSSDGQMFNSRHLTVFNLITFEKWSEDAFFYEKLIEGDTKAEKLFLEYKKMIIE